VEIFKLVRTKVGDQQGQVNTVADLDQEDKDEIRQAKVTMGEHPDHQGTEEQPVGKETGQQEAFSAGEVNQDETALVVTIDGPLGRVFTEALNKILAVESMMAMPMTPAALTLLKQEQPKTQVVKVNVFDEDMLKAGDVVDISNDITLHQEDQFVVAIESRRETRTVNSRTQLLSGLANHSNVQVSYRIQSAVRQVVRLVK